MACSALPNMDFDGSLCLPDQWMACSTCHTDQYLYIIPHHLVTLPFSYIDKHLDPCFAMTATTACRLAVCCTSALLRSVSLLGTAPPIPCPMFFHNLKSQ